MTRAYLFSLILASTLLAQGCASTEGVSARGPGASVDSRGPALPAPTQSWPSFLADLKAEALAAGISKSTVDRALNGAQIQDRALVLDRKQPEFNKTLGAYFNIAVPESRVVKAKEMLAANAALLNRIERAYGVPPATLVAFWGLESNFGSNLGTFRIVDTLATLAYEGRRGAFFRKQLMEALRIIDAGNVTADAMIGSWAGAMGQTQFMPSTLRAHGVDFDGDGRIDPWNSTADALASGAKYLSDLGWKAGEPWGYEVRLPPGLDLSITGIKAKRTLREWAALGVRLADGRMLPDAPGAKGAIILPAGYEGPAFLVRDNYFVILHWNRSLLYALAVGYLTDRMMGAPGLVTPPPVGDRPLRVSEVMEIQNALNRLGQNAGTPDGLVGAQTRAAIRRFQASQGYPADGHADVTLLRDLRAQGGQ